MKYKIILGMILLIVLINLSSAEINMWTQTVTDPDKQLVIQHSFFSIDDTSDSLITVGQTVPIIINGQTHNVLPFNISTNYSQYPNAIVDYCNFTITVFRNIYDLSLFGTTNYKIINTTLEITNDYFDSAITSVNHQINLRAKDSASVDMSCHYTNKDTLFIEGHYFGEITAFVPNYACKGCSEYSFEELSNENAKLQETVDQETSVYAKIQGLVDKNYIIWQIFSWFVKIALLLFSVGLLFAGMYYFYIFFKSIGDSIR
jgi:hypothetical protein